MTCIDGNTDFFLKTQELSEPKSCGNNNDDPEAESPTIVFEPIISLPLVKVETMEEEEEELLKIRGKLYRFENQESPAEWKERGLGDVKLLRHPKTKQVRILMRREKTLKICANHYVTPLMELKPHSSNSDKAFVWSTLGDFSEGQPRPETLCIRFGSIDNANKFKEAFQTAKKEAVEREEKTEDDHHESSSIDEGAEDSLQEGLEKLNITSRVEENEEPTQVSPEEPQKVQVEVGDERKDKGSTQEEEEPVKEETVKSFES